jgi:hypothetical protein
LGLDESKQDTSKKELKTARILTFFMRLDFREY